MRGLPAWADRGPFAWGPMHRYVVTGLDLVARAEADGIHQVAPILVAFRGGPAEVKRRIGRGLWRRVHHASLAENVARGALKLRTTLDFTAIMAIPPALLNVAQKLHDDYGPSACAFAVSRAKRPQVATEVAVLVRDFRLLGGDLNPVWSLRRLNEEHDRLVRTRAVLRADPTPFAEPWSHKADGYVFTRLVSHADFEEEAMRQKHCIATYANRAKAGVEVAFRIEGRERATVSFNLKTRHVELRGARNRKVSERLQQAVPPMFAAFLNEVKTLVTASERKGAK